MSYVNLIKCFVIVVLIISTCTLHGCKKWMVDNVKGGITDSTVVVIEVNVLDFDTASSDHEMIQLAINYAFENDISTVFIPAGTYQIDAAGVNGSKGILLKDGITLKLHDNAVLKAIPSNVGSYSIIRGLGLVDAKIIGGTILGERNQHIGTLGEWGMGIDIRNAQNIEIKNVLIKNCWGDGIYIGGTVPCKNILFENVTCDSNRRQGISVVNADGVVLKNSLMSNTSGVAPQSGVDLEPNIGQSVRNVKIIGSSFNKNSGKGIMLFGASGEVADVRIENCSADGNYQVGVQMSGGADTLAGRKVRRVSMSNVTISNTVRDAIYILSAENIDIDSTRVINSGRRAAWIVTSREIAIDSVGISNVLNAGFWITDSYNIAVSKSYLHVGQANVAAAGIVLEKSRDLVFSELFIKDGARAVVSTDVNRINLSNNRFERQINTGVRFDRTTNGIVNNCHFQDISQTPFFIHASTNSQFTNNVLIGNCFGTDDTYPVFRLSGTSSANTISGNAISLGSYTNKAKYGIWLMNTSFSNTVSSNTIASNSYVVSAIFDEGTNNSVSSLLLR